MWRGRVAGTFEVSKASPFGGKSSSYDSALANGPKPFRLSFLLLPRDTVEPDVVDDDDDEEVNVVVNRLGLGDIGAMGGAPSFGRRCNGTGVDDAVIAKWSSSSSEKMFGLNVGSGPAGKSSRNSVMTSVIWRGCKCSSDVLYVT